MRRNPGHLHTFEEIPEHYEATWFDFEDYYPLSASGEIFEDFQPYTKYYGRNVIWLGHEGHMFRADPEYITHIDGNIFDGEKLAAVAAGIEQAEEHVGFLPGYAQITKICPQRVKESIEYAEDEGLERPYTTDNEALDLWLVDPAEAFEEHAWDYEDLDEEMSQDEFDAIMEAELAVAVEENAGDLGAWAVNIRDGNHRAFGALLADEPYIYVTIYDNDYQRIKHDEAAGQLSEDDAELLALLE